MFSSFLGRLQCLRCFRLTFLHQGTPAIQECLFQVLSSTWLRRDIKMFENKTECFKITRQNVLIDVQNFQKVLRCRGTISACLENPYEVENLFLPWFNRGGITASIKAMAKVPFTSVGTLPQTYWKHCILFWPYWPCTHWPFKYIWPYKVLRNL